MLRLFTFGIVFAVIHSAHACEQNVHLSSNPFHLLSQEVGYLLRTLSKHLLEEDVQSIFG